VLIDKDFYGFNPAQAGAARGRLAGEANQGNDSDATQDLVAQSEQLGQFLTDIIMDAGTVRSSTSSSRSSVRSRRLAGSRPGVVAGQVRRDTGQAIPRAAVRAFGVFERVSALDVTGVADGRTADYAQRKA
jgi:hypothetical protein